MIRFYFSGNPVHDYCIQALMEGCPFEKTPAFIGEYEPSEAAVMFGMYKKGVPCSYPRGHIFDEQRRRGLRTLILDSGYVNRGDEPHNHYMVGWGGLNGRADFKNSIVSADRWNKLNVDLKPYKQGEKIYVCGQVPWDASVQNVDIVKWAKDTCHELRRHTKREIVYKPHPKAVTPPIEGFGYAYELKNPWAVVTYNSNIGVDCLIQGIPVFSFDEGSMVHEVSSHDLSQIESPKMPDRTRWAHRLAYAQWTPEEMRTETWKHLTSS